MKIGFTGTREGMTEPQAKAFAACLYANWPEELHHGCCLGADAAVACSTATLNRHFGAEKGVCTIVGHPGDWGPLTDKEAWLVVEKMLPLLGHIYPQWDYIDGKLMHWCAVVEGRNGMSRRGVVAPTAAEAVCRAALSVAKEKA